MRRRIICFRRWIIKKKGYIFKGKGKASIDPRAKIYDNCIIYEGCIIEGECEIFENVTIFPGSKIVSSKVGKGTKVYCATIDNSSVGACSSIGQGAVVRGRSNLGDFVKVGVNTNVKSSSIASNSSVGSLCSVSGAKIHKYCKVGDGVIIDGQAELFEGAKVGAGSVISGAVVVEKNRELGCGTVLACKM